MNSVFRRIRLSSKRSHFDVLGIPTSFEVNEKELSIALKKLQLSAHPDTGGNEELSASLNEAARVLRDPVSRAEYWLKLKGLREIEEDSRVDPKISMEIMELYEEIEEANPDQLAEIRQLLQEKINSLYESFRLKTSAEDWNACQKDLEALKLYSRMIKSLDD